MNIRSTALLSLLLTACSGTTDPGVHMAADLGARAAMTQAMATDGAIPAVDITQYTCALFVALRSHALSTPVSFGSDLSEAEVHWNMCPGGTMVACRTAPGADGRPVQVGIPWPYPPPTH